MMQEGTHAQAAGIAMPNFFISTEIITSSPSAVIAGARGSPPEGGEGGVKGQATPDRRPGVTIATQCELYHSMVAFTGQAAHM